MTKQLGQGPGPGDPRSAKQVVLGWLALALTAAATSPALAQANANSLQQLPGQNDAQKDMANSIDAVCPSLVDMQDELQGDEKDLQEVCTAMVQTANDIRGQGPTAESLGLDTAETNNALQSINGEELQTPDQQIVEVRDTQLASLQTRLDAIRTGTVGPGVSLAGLGLSDGESMLAADEFTDAEILPAQWAEGTFLSRLGLFATGRVILGDKDDTDSIDGYDFHTAGFTVGADYRLTDNAVLGAAFGYSHYDADFDDTPRSPDGQDLDSDTFGGSLFGGYYFDFGLFFDAIATVASSEFDSKRKVFIPNENDTALGTVDRTAKGDFDVFQYGFAARVGYDYTPEAIGGLTLTPIAGVEVLRADVDDFEEEGAGGLNLEFEDYTVESTTSNLGLEASYAVSTGIGVITPTIFGRWVHEFEDEDEPSVRYLNDPTNLSEFKISAESTDEDYGVVGASVAGQFAGGWAAFVDYATPVGLDDFTVHQIHFGLRKEF